jgi:hypothetical protein
MSSTGTEQSSSLRPVNNIQPKLGKKHRLRDGRVTSEVEPNFKGSPYPFIAMVNGDRRSWDDAGAFSSAAWKNCPCDIVAVID